MLDFERRFCYTIIVERAGTDKALAHEGVTMWKAKAVIPISTNNRAVGREWF